MLTIGKLKLEGVGTRPVSREHFKDGVRMWATELGLRLKFENRKKGHTYETASFCDVHKSRAVICESYDGEGMPLWELMEITLHEIAHWIQYNEGMFKKYFGETYYGGAREGSQNASLTLRLERHADWLSVRLLKELYGMESRGESCYDDVEEARKFIAAYHDEEVPF